MWGFENERVLGFINIIFQMFGPYLLVQPYFINELFCRGYCELKEFRGSFFILKDLLKKRPRVDCDTKDILVG